MLVIEGRNVCGLYTQQLKVLSLQITTLYSSSINLEQYQFDIHCLYKRAHISVSERQ